ncbi:hypothetical protein V6N12_055585 [Hibiscus sabdariffa]|uniref:RRM domain-containing protein n=1 Tax=Hibiscus sabdariffa TaxID=183260 RepID=A0ABR2BU84_9ROSI
MGSREVKPRPLNLRRRLGVSVFVDNVSKRIHQKALWEAFQVYGSVVDVYIALRNQKRKNKAATFAFVRFKSDREAAMVIERGNGRIMDGFKIVVRAAKENHRSSPVRAGEVDPVKLFVKNKKQKINFATLKDTISYKEVLLGANKDFEDFEVEGRVNRSMVQASLSNKGSCETEVMVVKSWPPQPVINEMSSCLIAIPKEEMKWKERCLVGEIKAMYNIEEQDRVMESMCQSPTNHSLNHVLNAENLQGKVWPVDVPIFSAGNSFSSMVRDKTWPPLVDSRVEAQYFSDSISNMSRFVEVNVEADEDAGSFVSWCEPRKGLRRSKKVVKKKSKADRVNSLSPQNLEMDPDCGTVEASPHLLACGSEDEEAEATFEIGGQLGVIFDAPDSVVKDRLKELEKEL